MKKQKFGLIAVVIILALLIVAFFALRRYNDVSEEREAAANTSIRILDVDESQVVGFTVENENGVFTFSRGDDEWSGADDAAAIESLNNTKIDDLLSSACLLTSDYAITEPMELSEYGLDEPRARVTIRAEGGGETVLSLGDDNDSIDRQYARVSGNSDVYCISQYTGGLYDFTADEITASADDEGDSDG